jgi:CRP/FNR family transcriptional regulator, cyclic AMP receptor protein
MDPNRLRSIELLAPLSDDDLTRIATFATETSAPEGQTLMREGDYATDLIGIEEGSADVVRDGGTIASLRAGDVVGEMGLIEKRRRSASVVATSPMRLIKLTHWDVRRLPAETRQRLEQVVSERRGG